MTSLRARRYEKGASITDVARATGLSRKTIRFAEAPDAPTPQAPTAKALADYYGVRVTDLWPIDPSTSAVDLEPAA